MSGFSMKVEEAFQVKGRGVILAGTVNSGILTPGEPLLFDGIETLCRGIETFGGRKNVGDKIGVLVDHRIDLPCAEERIGLLLITSDRPNEGETRFRIVINPHRPANRDGHFPWQCTLCGAAVAHVDRHAEWHERIEGIRYGDLLPGAAT